jgi:hypothetical protein
LREGRPGDLFLKQIRLVKEKDDRRLFKPLAVADRVKELERLVHAVLRVRLDVK